MYKVISDRTQIIHALGQWKKLLNSKGTKIVRTITHPQGAESHKITWLEEHNFWALVHPSENGGFWCPYGYAPTKPAEFVNISLQINPPITDKSKRARGRILKNQNGQLLLAHKGGRGGGRGGDVTIKKFCERIKDVPQVKAQWDDGTIESVFLLGVVDNPKSLQSMGRYLRQAEELAVEARNCTRLDRLFDYVKGLTEIPPGSTETKQEIQARVGQGRFRDDVLKRWDGVCAISGIRNLSLVRASHIRPWSKCKNECDRLNPANGLPLIPNYDALFDRGLISFDYDGVMLVSSKLSPSERGKLDLPVRLSRPLQDEELTFMKYHRKHVFKP